MHNGGGRGGTAPLRLPTLAVVRCSHLSGSSEAGTPPNRSSNDWQSRDRVPSKDGQSERLARLRSAGLEPGGPSEK